MSPARDQLTYRYPRTAIEAFGCDASTAFAGSRYRRPLGLRLVGSPLAVLLASLTVAAAILSIWA